MTPKLKLHWIEKTVFGVLGGVLLLAVVLIVIASRNGMLIR